MFILSAFVAAVCAHSASAPQDPARADAALTPAAAPAPIATAIPGRRPGTFRYLATLRDRSFDLSSYRAAIESGVDVEAFDAVVARLAQSAADDQADLAREVAGLGGEVTQHWWLVNGFALDLPASAAETLRNHPRVASLVLDGWRRPGMKTSIDERNHASIVAHRLGHRGRGTTIAIVDSGIDANHANSGRPHRTFFVNGDPTNQTGGGLSGSRLLASIQVGAQPAEDAISHGTAVAGVAAGAIWNATGNASDGHAPDASIVSLGVADQPNGYTALSTLVTAWQRVAADRVRYGITVACCSYEGYFVPAYPDQVAIDALALQGDVLIVGMGGNGGASAEYSYGAFNMLAVGATAPNTRAVSSFSSRGPLLFSNRTYPDLVANGESVRVPQADNEAGDRIATGTSYSAPMVAGAAALYRTLRPTATSTEVRAALLASTEDVSNKNTLAPFNSTNAYGQGYLRTDTLIAGARGTGVTFVASVSNAAPQFRFPLPVVAGKRYAIAAVWYRANPQAEIVSNLDLEVRTGATTIAASNSPANAYELVRIAPDASTTLDVAVMARSFAPGAQPQAFAIAVFEIPSFSIPGSLTTYGTSCRHSVTQARLVPLDSSLPAPGATYGFTLNYSPLFAAGLLAIGTSDTTFGGIPLPFDLGVLGAPTCALRTSVELTLPFLTSTGTLPNVQIRVPVDASLPGQRLYHQGLVLDPFANALGIATSNGIVARIGGDLP